MRFFPALTALANHLCAFSSTSTRQNSRHTSVDTADGLLYSREVRLKVEGYESLHRECQNFTVVITQYAYDDKPITVEHVMHRAHLANSTFSAPYPTLDEVCKSLSFNARQLTLLCQIERILGMAARSEAKPRKIKFAIATTDGIDSVYFLTKSEKAVVVAQITF